MKVLMLGWEYPPHIAGGLGTACEGLTKALARQGVAIHFVVPKMFGDEQIQHMHFSGVLSATGRADVPARDPRDGIIKTTQVPAFLTPYWSASRYKEAVAIAQREQKDSSNVRSFDQHIEKALVDGEVYGVDLSSALSTQSGEFGAGASSQASEPYAVDIFAEVENFTARVVSAFRYADFDIIHAHDWMTFPAAVALAEATKRPLVVHVHSLEHDRSGFFFDPSIDAIEKLGVTTADRVIAVSHYTKRSIEQRHAMGQGSIAVVHNGVYPRQVVNDYRQRKTWPEHVVLFLGRVTFQKGPDYFLEVAARVIPHVSDVLFVLAGTGDMLSSIVKEVNERSLAQYFLFPGFVQGAELEELFSVADLYVMPSVSEPFGLAALEAISFDTPVLLSRQSGVAELLHHALKSDFWDTQRMADLIINALIHRELREELAVHAKQEIASLHWDAAATKTVEIYRELVPAHASVL